MYVGHTHPALRQEGQDPTGVSTLLPLEPCPGTLRLLLWLEKSVPGGGTGPYLEAPGPWVPSRTENSSSTFQPTDELLDLGPSPPPFPWPSLLHTGAVRPGTSAAVPSARCHCRWTDGSIINFISWAPGKPRPIGKDKKCVYMTASRGEGEVGAERAQTPR